MFLIVDKSTLKKIEKAGSNSAIVCYFWRNACRLYAVRLCFRATLFGAFFETGFNYYKHIIYGIKSHSAGQSAGAR